MMDAAKDATTPNGDKQDISTRNGTVESAEPIKKGAQNVTLADAITQQKPNPWTKNMFIVSANLFSGDL